MSGRQARDGRSGLGRDHRTQPELTVLAKLLADGAAFTIDTTELAVHMTTEAEEIVSYAFTNQPLCHGYGARDCETGAAQQSSPT